MMSRPKTRQVLARALDAEPKTGTVNLMCQAIRENEGAKWNFAGQGRDRSLPDREIQFDGAKLAENGHAVINAVVKQAGSAKGKYVKRITLTSTMGGHHGGLG